MKAWLWRKYECGLPAVIFSGQPWEELEDKLVVWPALDCVQWPGLNRWQGLHSSFFGFASRGLAAPHACVYSATGVVQQLEAGLLSRSWVEGVDAAERCDWLIGNLLGVWMGEKTPYLMTECEDLLDVFLPRVSDFK